jgi:proteasome lid subunit RPN8/RPN11
MNMRAISGLKLTDDQLETLRSAASAAYPNEFCALLIGVDRPERKTGTTMAEVTRVVLADNVDQRPDRGFELDPRVLVRELRSLREATRGGSRVGERLLGHVHSHPDAPARPSARDLAQAHEAGQVWLIVPVRQGRVGTPRAFLAASDRKGLRKFEPIRIDGVGTSGSRAPARHSTTNSLIRRPARSR